MWVEWCRGQAANGSWGRLEARHVAAASGGAPDEVKGLGHTASHGLKHRRCCTYQPATEPCVALAPLRLRRSARTGLRPSPLPPSSLMDFPSASLIWPLLPGSGQQNTVPSAEPVHTLPPPPPSAPAPAPAPALPDSGRGGGDRGVTSTHSTAPWWYLLATMSAPDGDQLLACSGRCSSGPTNATLRAHTSPGLRPFVHRRAFFSRRLPCSLPAPGHVRDR